MDSWKLTYFEWQPEKQGLHESLLTLGNGYFATRGAAEESVANGIHYPGTYLVGGYNRLKSEVNGQLVENEDFVNWPNWLPLNFKIEGGDWFDLQKVTLLDYRIELDIQKGLLCRQLRFKDKQGNISRLSCRRIVSMHDMHMAAIQWILEPENWSADIQLRSGLDGNIVNQGVDEHEALNNRHLELLEKGLSDTEGIYLKVQTNQSNIVMVQAATTRFYIDDQPFTPKARLKEKESFIAQDFTVACSQGKAIVIEKIVSLYTSRDWAISEPGLEARKAVMRAGRFEELLKHHTATWKQLWSRCDIEITGDNYIQMVLRLHVFHLLQTASFNSIELDTGIPARGLHGEGYRGHIFWDELYIFPFFNLRIPELTRELIMYRYRRLREARHIAKAAGYRGACFPWQSGSDGQEETADLLLYPESGKWYRDYTYLQRHVNSAIAYNIWQYYQASHDKEFLSFYGARMFMEIALFWSSLATYSEEKGRYELKGVVGPDEYHTYYPGQDTPGLNNNAYTNVMASWVLQRAADVLNKLTESRRRELLESLKIDQQELERWQHISSKMYVPFFDEKIISQFEGYEKLKELDWQAYKKKYGEYMRLDFILEAEGDNVNNYKASKQADVLMLFYVFSYEELKQLLAHMGYHFPKEWMQENIRYYEERNSHGSTLSQLVGSWVLARSNRQKSWHYFSKALQSDINDLQGGSTKEGIHLGAMAGTVDMIQRGYTGMEIRDDVLWFDPLLPDHLEHVSMRICYRSFWFTLHLSHHKMEIYFEEGLKDQIRIGFRGKVHTSINKQTLTFKL